MKRFILGFIKLFILLFLVALAAFMARDPMTARQRLVELSAQVQEATKAKLLAYLTGNAPDKDNTAATATAAPEATPEATPDATPEAAATPEADAAAATTEATPEPTPDQDTPEAILASLSSDKSEWPQTVACTESLEFEAFMNGKPIGKVKVPAGTPLKFMGIQTDQVTVGYLTSKQVIPVSKTNLVSEVLAKRHGETPK